MNEKINPIGILFFILYIIFLIIAFGNMTKTPF